MDIFQGLEISKYMENKIIRNQKFPPFAEKKLSQLKVIIKTIGADGSDFKRKLRLQYTTADYGIVHKSCLRTTKVSQKQHTHHQKEYTSD